MLDALPVVGLVDRAAARLDGVLLELAASMSALLAHLLRLLRSRPFTSAMSPA